MSESMGVLATVHLEGHGPYSPSRMHESQKLTKEANDAYDQRTWQEKALYDKDGHVIIPRMAFKFALMDAAKYLGETIPGKGKKTWTGYFTSAVQIDNDLVLPLKKDQLAKVRINAHVSGDRKSGKRVLRTFPLVLSWKGTLEVYILDETITKEIFGRVLEYAGKFIGIGRFRPQNGGFNGRFVVKKIEWKKLSD